MSITDMTGKVKKIDVHITKTKLLKKFIFNNEEEKKHCDKYLDLKGVAYHVSLINFIGLDNNGMISYKLLSDVYKYDKRLRNRLYKFISAFEEQMRAFIANSYNHGLESLILGKTIIKNINSGSNIARELEELTLSNLIDIINKLNEHDHKRLFKQNNKHLPTNLQAIKELRNVISHHRILLLYDEYEECYINCKLKNDLKSNIKNLINLIDDYYKDYLTEAVNSSIYDKRDETFKIPKRMVIKI